jgi:sigma-E factor negative regulatory protein RseC
LTERAIIREIHDDHVICGCSTSACKSCGGNSFCNIKAREIEAKLPSNLRASVGDTVEIFLPPGKTILAGFMVMILPLLLFALGFFLLGLGLPESGEGVRVLGGLAGLTLGFAISWLYARLTKTRDLPLITGIAERA